MDQRDASKELQKRVVVAIAEVIQFLHSRGQTPELEDLAFLAGLTYDHLAATDDYFATSPKSRSIIAKLPGTTWEVNVYKDTDALTRLATLVLAAIISTVSIDHEVLVHFSDGNYVAIRDGHFDRNPS